MKNSGAISEVSRQMADIFKRIDSLTMGIEQLEQAAPDIAVTYQDLRLGELEQAQVLILELTKLITDASGDANMDEGGSVFAPGELTAEAGERDLDVPYAPV